MVARLKLGSVHPAGRHQAKKAFRNWNVEVFLSSCGGRRNQLALVLDNVRLLKQKGIFEECLLLAFAYTKPESHSLSSSILKPLIELADPQKLKAAGDPIPEQHSFQIYRGVSGRDVGSTDCGPSWTLSLDMACWYASVYRIGTPCVLSAVVANHEILAFTDSLFQSEVFCWPAKFRKEKLTCAEIEQRARRVMCPQYQHEAENHSKSQEAKSMVAVACPSLPA